MDIRCGDHPRILVRSWILARPEENLGFFAIGGRLKPGEKEPPDDEEDTGAGEVGTPDEGEEESAALIRRSIHVGQEQFLGCEDMMEKCLIVCKKKWFQRFSEWYNMK